MSAEFLILNQFDNFWKSFATNFLYFSKHFHIRKNSKYKKISPNLNYINKNLYPIKTRKKIYVPILLQFLTPRTRSIASNICLNNLFNGNKKKQMNKEKKKGNQFQGIHINQTLKQFYYFLYLLIIQWNFPVFLVFPRNKNAEKYKFRDGATSERM